MTLKTRPSKESNGEHTGPEKRSFIHPLPGGTYPPAPPIDDRLLRHVRRTPTRFITPRVFPSHGSAGFGRADDLTSVPPPNLRVLLVLQQMEHHVVSGGGVPQSWIFWHGDSSAATLQMHQFQADPTLPLPGPGEIWPIGLGSVIYSGLELGGCGSPSVSFPLNLESWVVEEADSEFGGPGETEFGRVTVSDQDTITTAGTYSFSYTIRASDGDGAVSDFELRGAVWANCVTDETL